MRDVKSKPEPVVLLVDSKTRDLDVATLIAMHLRGFGVECHLEPLEAFRASLAAYRPGMVIFNHLTAGHLVAWSQKLAAMGVLTAVLPNEGIAIDKEDLYFLAGRHHPGAHIDYVFCWNAPHEQAMRTEWGDPNTQIEIVGVPRFDFYFDPWSRALYKPPLAKSARPRLLVCTNFIGARYWELPRDEGDRFFAPWVGRLSVMNNYWKSIEAHWRARNRLLDYLDALLKADKYQVVLRAHPREDSIFYSRWIAELPEVRRRNLRFDTNNSITPSILECDLEISCEVCTTALESWIVNKPTVELIFERDPLWYRENISHLNIECDDSSNLPQLVDRLLKNPVDHTKIEARRRFLETCCGMLDGQSSKRVATTIARAIHSKKPADWSKLTLNDYRRAAKLHAYRSLGLAYHFDPLMSLKLALFGDRYAIKNYAYQKSIKPRDTVEKREQLERAMANIVASGDEELRT